MHRGSGGRYRTQPVTFAEIKVSSHPAEVLHPTVPIILTSGKGAVIPVLNSALHEDVWVEVWLHSFLTPALYGDEWSDSRLGCLVPAETGPGRYWMGLQIWSERCGEEKKLLPLPRIETQFLGYPSYSLVTILTELPLLLDQGGWFKWYYSHF
jgi:hypothetical protein